MPAKPRSGYNHPNNTKTSDQIQPPEQTAPIAAAAAAPAPKQAKPQKKRKKPSA